jgi:hypothetical protein
MNELMYGLILFLLGLHIGIKIGFGKGYNKATESWYKAYDHLFRIYLKE